MTTAAILVLLHTSLGDVKLELNAEKAPITTQNFVTYVKEGFYDGTIFHRVISGFMVQGGGMDANMKEKKTHAPITNEGSNGLKNVKYSIAMARTSDPNSATAQFFINVANNSFLDFPGQDGHGYAVFGKVTEGFDVIDKMAAVKTGNKGFHQDVPLEAITIEKALIVE